MRSMASATRSYGGITAGERRATRRGALIEAALDLFAEGGVRAVSKRAVCARARLNDRYFYEHFTRLRCVARSYRSGSHRVGIGSRGRRYT